MMENYRRISCLIQLSILKALNDLEQKELDEWIAKSSINKEVYDDIVNNREEVKEGFELLDSIELNIESKYSELLKRIKFS